MPENLTIGFFVLGAVLILVALVGGKFKIFVAEVSPAVTNPFIRMVAFILGIGFIFLALYPGMLVGASAENNIPAPFPAVITQSGLEPILPDQTLTQADPQPTSTNTPIPPQPSPVDFVVSYWQNVSVGKFDSAWLQLTPGFRQAMHNDDYADYVRGYQAMNLCRIVIANPNLIQQDTYSATVTVHVTYYTGSQCNSTEYDFENRLIYDAVANIWLFDRNSIK